MRPTIEGQTARALKDEIQKGYGLLKTLRDEIRVDLHLGTMEAKDRWSTQLEPRFLDIERKARQAKHLTKEVLEQAIREFKDFREGLKKLRA